MRNILWLKTEKIKGKERSHENNKYTGVGTGPLITGCQDGYIQETGEALMENTADASFAPGSL